MGNSDITNVTGTENPNLIWTLQHYEVSKLGIQYFQ